MLIENKMMRIIGMALFSDFDNTDVNVKTDINISEKELAEMFSIGENHDISNIVGYSLKKSGILKNGEIGKKYERKILESYGRFIRIDKTAMEVFGRLEDNNIEYIPLKGAVIKDLYPEPWLRTTCDIDILVKNCDTEKTVELLENLQGYHKMIHGTGHDITVISKTGVHVEVHYKLLDGNKSFIAEPWKYADLKSGSRFELSNEFLYCYNLAHAAKHFQMGGCGLRTFIDLSFLEKKLSVDKNLLNSMLNECGLSEFNRQMLLLASNLFDGNELNELQRNIFKYVIAGGMYGTRANSRKVKLSDKSKLKYLLKRIWASEKEIVAFYPSAENNKMLMPVYQVRRWIDCVKNNRFKMRINEMNRALNEQRANIDFVKNILDELKIAPE